MSNCDVTEADVTKWKCGGGGGGVGRGNNVNFTTEALFLRTNSAVWTVPYACAQLYHPSSGSCFVLTKARAKALL